MSDPDAFLTDLMLDICPLKVKVAFQSIYHEVEITIRAGYGLLKCSVVTFEPGIASLTEVLVLIGEGVYEALFGSEQTLDICDGLLVIGMVIISLHEVHLTLHQLRRRRRCH